MQDTACENCPYKSEGKQCPNYIETIWHEDGSNVPKLIKDCAPKRTLLMLQDLYNRTFALQKQVNQYESQMISMRGIMDRMIASIRYVQQKSLPPILDPNDKIVQMQEKQEIS